MTNIINNKAASVPTLLNNNHMFSNTPHLSDNNTPEHNLSIVEDEIVKTIYAETSTQNKNRKIRILKQLHEFYRRQVHPLFNR
mgnify:FL=1